MQITELVVGQYYRNYDLYTSMGTQNVGGIRPKIVERSVKFIVLTSSMSEADISFARNPYSDRIEGDLLIYTAAGLVGDQTLAGPNKRIVEQYEKPFPIFGFMNEGSKRGRRFLGLLELLRHYQEVQVDGKRQLRVVWAFELRIHNNPSVVPLEHAEYISGRVIEESRSKTPDEERGEVIFTEDSHDLVLPEADSKFGQVRLEELRSRLLLVDPYKFEVLIKDTVERNGFYNAEVTKRSGDGGIDVNAYFDPTHYFARDVLVQFQAKKWKHSVGRKEVAQLRGSLAGQFGVLITTSHFTPQATREARESGRAPIVLVDGIHFAEIVTKLDVPFETYLPSSS